MDAFAACLLLGAFCSRFRDVPPIVGSVMQIAFFVTPIVWRPEQLGARGWWLPYNPFDALLEMVRQPLLGHEATWQVWGLAAGYSAFFCALAWFGFARVRTRPRLLDVGASMARIRIETCRSTSRSITAAREA